MDNKLIPPIAIMAICLVCIVIILAGLKKALRLAGFDNNIQRSTFTRTGIIILVWLIIMTALAVAGFFKVFTLPPRVPATVILPVIVILIISFTAKCKKLIRAVPPHWLLAVQSFRIGVELWLWYAFTKGLIPGQMTLRVETSIFYRAYWD